MITLHYIILIFVFILNLLDLYYTDKFIKIAGLDLEANPLARWLYKKWGTKGIVGLKAIVVIQYLMVMFTVTTSLTFVLNLIIAFIYTWVVSRGQTIVGMLDE